MDNRRVVFAQHMLGEEASNDNHDIADAKRVEHALRTLAKKHRRKNIELTRVGWETGREALRVLNRITVYDTWRPFEKSGVYNSFSYAGKCFFMIENEPHGEWMMRKAKEVLDEQQAEEQHRKSITGAKTKTIKWMPTNT